MKTTRPNRIGAPCMLFTVLFGAPAARCTDTKTLRVFIVAGQSNMVGTHSNVEHMDNRENMHAIRTAQKAVANADPRVDYIPTSHDAVEIGGDVGLHYHYGTLGQLEHGANYADAYLHTTGKQPATERPLKVWPDAKGSPVKFFVLARHRNMEGERAFAQDPQTLSGHEALAKDNDKIAFKNSFGGGFKASRGWEPLGPAGFYDTFGPELSFGRALQAKLPGNIAIAKFTHSGSQLPGAPMRSALTVPVSISRATSEMSGFKAENT